MVPPPGYNMMPPGMFPPPMMMPPPGFFRPRKSPWRILLTTFTTILLVASLITNIVLLASSSGLGLSSGKHYITQTLVEGDASQKIAVVPVSGVIMQSTAERFDHVLTALEGDKTIKALILEIETPGGAVTPSDEMYARVMRFRASNPGVRVIASMGNLATSGGYYVACSAEHIFAQKTTLTGNIGVLMPRMNLSKLSKAYGVEEVTITAPNTGFKNAGSMFSPVKEEETLYLQGLIDDMFANFKKVVVAGRGKRLTKPIDQIANGKVYTEKEALQLGLVDQEGYLVDAVQFAATGLSNKHVVRYAPRPPSLVELLGGAEGKANLSTVGNVTINGINLNIDSSLFDELGRPRAMYLWRGQ